MSGGASGEAERRNTPETELDLTAGDQPPPPGAQALPPAAAMVFEASLYRGPLPDPGTLREYDEVVPGCAKQIIDEWQSQTRHRHEQEAGSTPTSAASSEGSSSRAQSRSSPS